VRNLKCPTEGSSTVWHLTALLHSILFLALYEGATPRHKESGTMYASVASPGLGPGSQIGKMFLGMSLLHMLCAAKYCKLYGSCTHSSFIDLRHT